MLSSQLIFICSRTAEINDQSADRSLNFILAIGINLAINCHLLITYLLTYLLTYMTSLVTNVLYMQPSTVPYSNCSLHCTLAAVQCIVITPVCGFVCRSVTMLTRNWVQRSSPNWVCRWR